MHKIFTFKSGLRLVVEPQNCNSVALNVVVNTGSVNEEDFNNGISHFIEHTMFKGTQNRTAKEITIFADEIGANINAFTSEFLTCYHTLSVNKNLEKCFELLSDMLLNSLFEDEELNKERNVILEELTMYADDPSTVAEESAMAEFYAKTPLSRPIIGTKKSLANIHHNEIMDYVKKHYTPNNIIISLAGNVTPKTAKMLTEKYFEANFSTQEKPVTNAEINIARKPTQNFVFSKKDIEQSHICMLFPACNLYNKSLTSTEVMNTIFGSTMSSRLFQRIRENLGYVYTIRSYFRPSYLGGDLCIYFATNPINVENAISHIRSEIDEIIKNGFTEQELKKATNYLASYYLVKFDKPANVANRNAENVFNYGRVETLKEKLSLINNVTLEEINEMAKTILCEQPIISLVAKNSEEDLTKTYSQLK